MLFPIHLAHDELGAADEAPDDLVVLLSLTGRDAEFAECGRIQRESAKRELSFREPSTIADYYMETLRHREQESVYCLMLMPSISQ